MSAPKGGFQPKAVIEKSIIVDAFITEVLAMDSELTFHGRIPISYHHQIKIKVQLNIAVFR